MTSEGEQFIRDEAALRGIDPQVACDVAKSEGGVEAPGLVGEFSTGTSFYQFQLHWGGPDYPQFGTPGSSVAGMGNDFTALTGWPVGIDDAWRDACRFALNAAKRDGWGAWYGAAAIGITGYDGIDQSVAWDPNSQVWDYEVMGGGSVTSPTYNVLQPAFSQNDDWSCAPTSTRWGLWAYGREPTEQWLESSMLSAGVVTTQYGLMDASGAGLAAWLNAEYGPAEYGGYVASNDPSVTFDDVAAEAEQRKHPLMIGGRSWGAGGHWTGVRAFDPTRRLLLLANPASGYAGITQTLSREQFGYVGPFSLVRLTHPGESGASPGPRPPSGDPYADWRATVGSGLISMMQEDGTFPAQSASTWLPLGKSPADVEECLSQDGTLYRWTVSTTNQGFRYRPS